MPSNSYAEITLAANQPYIQAVLENTWGHFAPTKNKTYKCILLFSVSAFGGPTRNLIDCWFTDELTSSPWLYDQMNNIINKAELPKASDGKVFILIGTMRNYRWWYKIQQVYTLPNEIITK